MTEPVSHREPGPITAVHPGMRVLDADGVELGTVGSVRMADPDEVPAESEWGPSNSLMGVVAEAFSSGDPHAHPQLAERLTRTGYVTIDGKDPGDRDRYVAADEIADVSDGVVRLRLPRDQLVSRP